MLEVEISTVDPGICFLIIKFVIGDGLHGSIKREEMLFANEVPLRKVQAIIGSYLHKIEE
jgi:hypothetical protein